uniref:HSFtype DNAbinding protein putative n=1 Tax=Albugo laibachii Nc14 TaxID=890382 RepID=F0WFR4_9STRA|nr:HSFtype DNAbinding protein putative [Albugo laibachii Nc14]|eukprot:CCA20048.1 HSFtype DNAbinding protein putative [Albugo laibachii Nc14]
MARATTMPPVHSLHPSCFWKEARTPTYLLPSLLPPYRSSSTTAAATALCRVQGAQDGNILYDPSTPRSHGTEVSHQQGSESWKSGNISPLSRTSSLHSGNDTSQEIAGSEKLHPVLTISKSNVELHYIRRRNVSVPKFLRCLYEILKEEDPLIIAWSHYGTAFQIKQPALLATQILPNYFKHRNVSSFQRQLNYFGFKKWTKTQTDICTFSHPCFVRDNKEKMRLIKRKERKINVGTLIPSLTTEMSREQSGLRYSSSESIRWNPPRENHVEYRASSNRDFPNQTMRNSSDARFSATPYVVKTVFPQALQRKLRSADLDSANNQFSRLWPSADKVWPDYLQARIRSDGSPTEHSPPRQSDLLFSFDNITSESRQNLISSEERGHSCGSQKQWNPFDSINMTTSSNEIQHFEQANARQYHEYTQPRVATGRHTSCY